MYNYSRAIVGSYRTETTQNGVVIASSNNPNGPHTNVQLTGSNLNVQGDKSTPNPISFTRNERGNMGRYYQRLETVDASRRRVVQTFWGCSETESNLGISSPRITFSFNETRDCAMAKVYDQIRGASNGVVDFLEGNQTAGMVRDVFRLKKVVSGFVNDMIRGKWSRKADYLTNKWLEYRYGWKPLVSSIYDALDDTYLRSRNEVHVVKGRCSRRLQALNKSGNGSYLDPLVLEKLDLSYRTEIGAQFRLPDSKQIYDYTSLNPVGIAWELLPFSFVADWVLNVGDCLSAWENYFTFNTYFVKGYRTDSFLELGEWRREGLTQAKESYLADGSLVPSQTLRRYVRNLSTRRLSSKARVQLGSLPFPSGIYVNVNLNATRFADAGALLWQQAKRR